MNIHSRKKEIKWKEAIIKAIEECGGVATLKELYKTVPKIKGISPNPRNFHIIRGFLTRMARYTQEIQRIGLGTYALLGIKIKSTIEKWQREGNNVLALDKIPSQQLHSAIEGMLLELGNIYGYLTYTPDLCGMFNGKPLSAFANLEKLPQFTSSQLERIIKNIDVLWFKKRALITVPKHAFEIERTTNFINALNRFYQLRDFQMNFYIISSPNKMTQFKQKIRIDPYREFAEKIHFRSFESIVSLYKIALEHFEMKEKIITNIPE